MLQFQKIALHPEYFGEVTVAKLCDNIKLGKIAGILRFRKNDIDELYNVRMLAALQENNFSENSPSFRQRIEYACDLFYCHRRNGIFSHSFRNMAIGTFSDNFFDLIVGDVLGREDLIDVG